MSINIIKNNINELSMKSSRLIMSFLDIGGGEKVEVECTIKRFTIQSFSMKTKIRNCIYSILVDYMESKSSLIINKETRKNLKKVYFSDDITLPSCEIKSLTQEIKHEVNEDEYLEIMQYKNSHNNQDLIKATERRKRRRQKKRNRKRINELKIYALNIQLNRGIK